MTQGTRLLPGMSTWLRENLVEYFSKEELRTFCVDLQVDYEELPGEGTQAKARELIAYFDRRERIPELIGECTKLRPHIDWKKAIYVTPPPPPPPPPPPTTEPTGVGVIWSGLSSLPALVWIGIVLLMLVLAGFAIYQWVRSPDEQTPPPYLTVSEPSGPTLTAGALVSPASTLTTTLTPTITVASTSALTSTDTPTSTATFTPTLTLTSALTPTDTLVPSPTISPTPCVLECTPIGGIQDPSVCVASVSVQINEGTPISVAYNQTMTLKIGDTLSLMGLRYCTSRESLADGVGGEAYLFDCDENYLNCDETYDYGLFTRGGPCIRACCGDVGDFVIKDDLPASDKLPNWVLDEGRHKVVIALVHYYGNDYEVDDRFHIKLDVKP